MRKAFAIALLCAGLGACNKTWMPVVQVAGDLAAEAAAIECGKIAASNAALYSVCTNAAGAAISVGEAKTVGALKK
jgi:hypothetical protein